MYILNSPILTGWGKYEYKEISKECARRLLDDHNFVSAVGHEATAEVLSRILGVEVPANRIRIKMEPGDKAIVFQLLRRLPEGKILSEGELEELPFRLGLLAMIAGEQKQEGRKLSVVLPSGGNHHRQSNFYKILVDHPPKSRTVSTKGGGSWLYSLEQYLLPEQTLIIFYYHSTHPGPGWIRLCRVKKGSSCEPSLPGNYVHNLEVVESVSTAEELPPQLYVDYMDAIRELAEEDRFLRDTLERWDLILNTD